MRRTDGKMNERKSRRSDLRRLFRQVAASVRTRAACRSGGDGTVGTSSRNRWRAQARRGAARSAPSACAIAISVSGSSSASSASAVCGTGDRRSRTGACGASRAIGGRTAARSMDGGRACAIVVRTPFGRCIDGGGDAAAARRVSGVAVARGDVRLREMSDATWGDPAEGPADVAAACRTGGIAAGSGGAGTTGGVPPDVDVAVNADVDEPVDVDGAARTATASAVWMGPPGVEAPNGSCIAISAPMMPSAPMLQHAAYIARRWCDGGPARAVGRPAAATATDASAAGSADAGSGSQRHARCGAPISMHDVDSVARQRLSRCSPDAPRKIHSRPNGGTSSSGAARGRASAPSTGTRDDGVMRKVRLRHRATVPAAARMSSQT
ncbi:hypothetical protein BPS26883_01921 [Burkholderia pseudomultivorans]|uniref:Uncharacterized protein n=1 Tax=Burkholderia pseudomultivorans TaxID=1207504 RepID=A0A6P2JKA9_9BURK|nr:hypothetical protein BPS26883_01921 [Burkholderia pseudomultivorans]